MKKKPELPPAEANFIPKILAPDTVRPNQQIDLRAVIIDKDGQQGGKLKLHAVAKDFLSQANNLVLPIQGLADVLGDVIEGKGVSHEVDAGRQVRASEAQLRRFVQREVMKFLDDNWDEISAKIPEGSNVDVRKEVKSHIASMPLSKLRDWRDQIVIGLTVAGLWQIISVLIQAI